MTPQPRSVGRHALDRAQRGLRVSSPIALDKRRTMLGYDALQELEQQFQVSVAGFGGDAAAYTQTTLHFSVEFFDAPEQRDSSLAVPHFTFGAVLDNGQVVTTASVNEWIRDDRGAFIGAVVTVGVCAPGGTGGGSFTGYFHLTFQGYGALSENDAVLDVGV